MKQDREKRTAEFSTLISIAALPTHIALRHTRAHSVKFGRRSGQGTRGPNTISEMCSKIVFGHSIIQSVLNASMSPILFGARSLCCVAAFSSVLYRKAP